MKKIWKELKELLYEKESSDSSQELSTSKSSGSLCTPFVKPKETEDVEKQHSKNKDLQKGEILHIPVDRIRSNPHQPRRYFDEISIESLANTIKMKGILQPVIVKHVNSPEADYQLIAGERRLRAVKRLGIDTIPAIIRDDIADSDIRALALIENLQREDLSVLDKAQGFYDLKEELGDSKTAAETLGISKKTVERYVKIAKTVYLIPELEEIIINNNLDFTKCFKLCLSGEKLLKVKENDREAFFGLIERFREGKAYSNAIKSVKSNVSRNKEKRKSQKIDRKNFWSTDTELGLHLKAKRKDTSKPEIREFLIDEVRKFLTALGIKSFELNRHAE